MERAAFDKELSLFLEDLDATIQDAAPAACLFLKRQVEMVRSLRYRDRLFGDLQAMVRVLPPGARVLDLGTGSGIVAVLMAAQPGIRVAGIDIETFNENGFHACMAEEQRLFWPVVEQRHCALRFQHYAGRDLPFAPASFDMVVAYGVIEHIPDLVLADVMHGVARVIRPGGYLAIGYLPRTWAWHEAVLRCLGRWYHRRRWGDREIRRFLEGYGYAIRLFERVIYAPQYPASFANRWKPLFDAMDGLAKIPPFSLLARDLLIIAQRKAGAGVDGAYG